MLLPEVLALHNSFYCNYHFLKGFGFSSLPFEIMNAFCNLPDILRWQRVYVLFCIYANAQICSRAVARSWVSAGSIIQIVIFAQQVHVKGGDLRFEFGWTSFWGALLYHWDGRKYPLKCGNWYLSHGGTLGWRPLQYPFILTQYHAKYQPLMAYTTQLHRLVTHI